MSGSFAVRSGRAARRVHFATVENKVTYAQTTLLPLLVLTAPVVERQGSSLLLEA
jgi:hypothetical protein